MTALDVTERPPSPIADEETGTGDSFFEPGTRGPAGPWNRWHLPKVINWPETIVTFVVLAFLSLFVFKYLQPSKLFLNSTASGGDMGAHVWQGWYLTNHLLTHFRLTGWAPDWYAGFPALVFYFPLPFLMMSILSHVVGYNVAFKLITVLGILTLPAAAWVFGRLARFRFPGPVCLAAATVPYLFSRNFTIYGGNIASTMAGEFGFSISLSLALVFLGVVARGLETGKYRTLASILLVSTVLCHLLPAIFAVIGAVVLTVMRRDRRSWRWMVPVFVVGGALAAFWAIPFVFRLPYATDMGYQKVTQYLPNLLPKGQLWLFLLAALGFLMSILRRQKLGIFVAVMAVISVLIFRFGWPLAPRLWNARVLPFWFLCLYLLAAVGLAEGGAALLEPLRAGPVPTWSRVSTLALPVVVAAAVWIVVGFPLHGLPFGSTNPKTGRYTWLGLSTADSSFIPSWVNWNYSGYQSNGKVRKNEYFGLVNTMEQLGKTDGCGRAMWEYEPELDEMGTPDALMLLPYWTNSCIGSMEGLYYESSATTPYHFVNAAELSLQPSDPVRGLTYPSAPDITQGIQHLQLLGVKYYMALTPQTQSQAAADPDLRLVATSGPWPVSYTTGPATGLTQRTWKIYEVSNSQIVSPLINQPVVMKGVSKGGQGWLTASMAWYLDDNVSDVMYAASGPKSWARVSPSSTSPPRTALQPVQVSDVTSNDSSVSFNVDTIGVPVLVKASYFPNWQAHGAKGPYRVAPNLMVVIPTSHHVWLHYGNTPVDWFGYLLGIMGLVALVGMYRADPVVYASTGRGLGDAVAGGTPGSDGHFASISGHDDAYARLTAELSVGLQGRLSGEPDPTGAHELDSWLGFPGGLGTPPAAPPPPLPPTRPTISSAASPASTGPASTGPASTGPASTGQAAADDSDRADDVVWLGSSPGERGRPAPQASGRTQPGSDETDVDDSRGTGPGLPSGDVT